MRTLPDESIVDRSIGTARRTVLIAFAVSAAVIALLVGERLLFGKEITQAADDARKAATLSGEILLADERLTMSANMAAATGESRWIARYEENIPLIDRAIADAKRLAPPDIAARLDEETRAANDALVVMERQSFEFDRQGRLAEARAILDGPDYAYQKQILAEGSGRFNAALTAFVDSNLAGVKRRALLIVGGILLLAATGFLIVWRSLMQSLGLSREAYLDAEHRIQKLAMHDPLTGLPNRRQFQKELERTLARCGRRGEKAAVLMLDLDRFKQINDRFGHGVGDCVLVELGKQLSAARREGEMCARLGGDEFVLVTAFKNDTEEAYLAATRLIKALSVPIEIDGIVHTVGATSGIAVYPDDGDDAGELMRKADVALYRSKREQRGDARFFEETMDEEMRERASVEADLRRAIDGGEIKPYFQPLVNLETGRIESFEILARWFHPSGGLRSPGSFIQVAEDVGLIDDLFFSVLSQACEAARPWPGEVGIAVNIAPLQLARPWLAERILAVLAETGFPPRRLEIEITENALITNFDCAKKTVLSLKNLGVRLALDDFGTGYSSLLHLRALPFDRIKIDGSFVKSVTTDEDAATMVSAIVSLAHSLDLPTTAECVETDASAKAMKAAGCATGQGWHYGAAMSAQDAERVLSTETAAKGPRLVRAQAAV